MSSPDVTPPDKSRAVAYAAIVGLFLLLSSPPTVDAGAWSQLRFGQDALNGGRLVLANVYSYLAPPLPWLNIHWLADLLLAQIWRVGGWHALVALQTVVAALTFLLAVVPWLKRKVHPSLLLLCTALMLLLCGHTDINAIGSRSLTYLLFSATVALLVSGVLRWLPAWVLAFVPPLFWLWLNLDSTAVSGLLVFFLAVVGAWCGKLLSARDRLWLTAAAVLSAAVCFFSPFGSDLLMFGWHQLLRPSELSNSHPLHLASPLGIAYVMLAGLCVAACTAQRNAGSPFYRLCAALPLIAILLSPLIALKYLPFATLAAVFALGCTLASEQSAFGKRIGNRIPDVIKRDSICIWAYWCVVISALVALVFINWRFHPDTAELPAGAVEAIKQNHLSGNLAIGGFADWGDYALFQLYPQVKVAIDSRWDAAYGPAQLAEYQAFRWGTFPWQMLISGHGTNLVLADKATANFNLMKLVPGWHLVWEDQSGGLFVKDQNAQAPGLSK